MQHRVRWLRTRYVRRFKNGIEEEHILKLASSPSNSWMRGKLDVGLYEDEIDKDMAWDIEMNRNHAETLTSTGGNLKIRTSKKLPWFLREHLSPTVIRPVINWILKRYPGRDPPRCGGCLSVRATQEHIASCGSLLSEMSPDTPARFRPEKLLSSRPETNIRIFIHQLSVAIATAVTRAIPEFDFEILSAS